MLLPPPFNVSTVVFVVIAFIAGIALMRCLSVFEHYVQVTKNKKRFKRGAEGEKEALSYLRHHGFTISKVQGETTATLTIDSVPNTYTLRADYLAVKKGKRCVVEVKTGKKAIDPLFSDTRRQLLEYAVAYDVDKVYLFNADEGALLEITFPMLKKFHHRSKWLKGFIVGLAAGAVATMFWRQ